MHRILVIDDDTYMCKLLTNYLIKHAYQADAAFNGLEAIKKIDHQSYDLVISDYRLPDRDGFDILHHVKQQDPGIPVIIMTAYKGSEYCRQTHQIGGLRLYYQTPHT
jgi:two-component system response regulator HydG